VLDAEVGRGGRPACNGHYDPTGLCVAGRSVRAVEEICIRPVIIDGNGDVQGARRQADCGAAARCFVCLRVVHECIVSLCPCGGIEAAVRPAHHTIDGERGVPA
jgi:hypothetical protein